MSRCDLQQGHRAHQNLFDSTWIDEPCFLTAATLVNRGHVEKCLCILEGKHQEYKLSFSAQERFHTRGIVAPGSLPSHWSFPFLRMFSSTHGLSVSFSLFLTLYLCLTVCAGIRFLGTHDCAGGFNELSLSCLPPHGPPSLLFPHPHGLKLLTATIRDSIMNEEWMIWRGRVLRSNCKWRES